MFQVLRICVGFSNKCTGVPAGQMYTVVVPGKKGSFEQGHYRVIREKRTHPKETRDAHGSAIPICKLSMEIPCITIKYLQEVTCKQLK